jgi:hypothetical protein
MNEDVLCDSRCVAVIVNYNGADVLPRCIDSLLSLEVAGLAVLVVDNGSVDQPRSYVPVRSDVRLLELPSNTGFAGGASRGVCEALGDPSVTAVAVLNSDLVFDKSFVGLVEAVSHGQWSPGLYSPLLRDADGSVQNAGQCWSPSTGRVTTRLTVRDPVNYDGVVPLDVNEFLCGAVIVAQSEVLRRINFDAELFLLSEDLDLCMRAHSLGLPVCIAADASVVHISGATFRKIGGLYSYYSWRNSLLMSARYASSLQFACRLCLFSPQLVHFLLALLRRREFDSLIPALRGAVQGFRRGVWQRLRPELSKQRM